MRKTKNNFINMIGSNTDQIKDGVRGWIGTFLFFVIVVAFVLSLVKYGQSNNQAEKPKTEIKAAK